MNETNAPKILVIDDEPAILNLLKVILGQAGYQTQAVWNCSLAFQALEENRFDCIITDAIMPMMTGFDFVRAIRRNPMHQNIPILMLTRRRRSEDVKRAVESGISDYVLKPIDAKLLLQKVEICIKKHPFSQGEVALTPEESERSQLTMSCTISAMNEMGISVNLPFALTGGISFHFESPLFEKIGIRAPLVQFTHSEKINDGQGTSGPKVFRNYFKFIALPEEASKKLRAWLHREAHKAMRVPAL